MGTRTEVTPSPAAAGEWSFGLSLAIREDFARVFRAYPTIERVLIFGSRAKGTARPASDIDLAVVAPGMSASDFAALWAAADSLPSLFKLDLLHWDALENAPLKEKILREGRVFYQHSDET